MSDYDYIDAKSRLEEILDGNMDIIESDEKIIPKDEEFTFDNGHYGWVTALFVDIRESTELFNDEDREKVAKIIRCFTSEIIEILRKDDNLREIGIRGDCVYAIYSTPEKPDVFNVANYSFWINTYVKMLNKMLAERDLLPIRVGIGVSTDMELVVKAGRKNVGINNKVWIGSAVTGASNLSSMGNKGKNEVLMFSELSYKNFIDELENNNKDKNVRSWFTKCNTDKLGEYYTANIIKVDFDEWIKQGMKK